MALLARTGQPVGSMPLTVHYDPAAFAVVKVVEGDFFRQAGAQSSFSQDVDAAGGKISIEASQPGGKGSGGGGTVVTVTLKALVTSEKADLSVVSAAPSNPAGATMGLTTPAAQTLRVVE